MKKVMAFRTEIAHDDQFVPAMLALAGYSVLSENHGNFTFEVDASETFGDVQAKLWDAVGEMDCDLHRCAQTLAEGTEPNEEWYNDAETLIELAQILEEKAAKDHEEEVAYTKMLIKSAVDLFEAKAKMLELDLVFCGLSVYEDDCITVWVSDGVDYTQDYDLFKTERTHLAVGFEWDNFEEVMEDVAGHGILCKEIAFEYSGVEEGWDTRMSLVVSSK